MLQARMPYLQWLNELPLKIQLQSYRYLISGEANIKSVSYSETEIAIVKDTHVLRWQLKLVFAQGIQAAKGHVRVRDIVLPGREKL